jgi:hypothetical protein
MDPQSPEGDTMNDPLLTTRGTKEVFVLGTNIRQNAQSGARKPVLLVRDSYEDYFAHGVGFHQDTEVIASYVYDPTDPMRCNVHVWFDTTCGLMVRTSLEDTHQFELLPAGQHYRIFASVLTLKGNRDGTTNLPALIVRTNESWDLKQVYEVRVRYPGTAEVITLDNGGVTRTRLDLSLVIYHEEAA